MPDWLIRNDLSKSFSDSSLDNWTKDDETFIGHPEAPDSLLGWNAKKLHEFLEEAAEIRDVGDGLHVSSSYPTGPLNFSHGHSLAPMTNMLPDGTSRVIHRTRNAGVSSIFPEVRSKAQFRSVFRLWFSCQKVCHTSKDTELLRPVGRSFHSYLLPRHWQPSARVSPQVI